MLNCELYITVKFEREEAGNSLFPRLDAVRFTFDPCCTLGIGLNLTARDRRCRNPLINMTITITLSTVKPLAMVSYPKMSITFQKQQSYLVK